jgi:fucose 4-O-acetylase-like acetyltransferase
VLTWTNGSYGALFPLLPWFGFVALGAVFARWRGRVGIFVMGAVVAWITSQLIPGSIGDHSHAQPGFFLERLCWVLLLGAGFASCRLLSELKLLQFVGKNSLVLYVIHLQIIYSVLLNLSGFKNMTSASAVWISLPITLAGSLGVVWLLSHYVYPKILKRHSA